MTEKRLATAIRDTLTELARGVDAVVRKDASVFSSEPPLLRLVSSVAEGVDRICAFTALDLDYVLACPLPFAREEYAKDFRTKASRAEFETLVGRAEAVFELDGDPHERDLAYEQAGFMVLRQSDLLIAVWNGQKGSGRGGTAEIVRTAASSGIPVIWIDPDDPKPRLMLKPSSLGGVDLMELAEHATDLDRKGIDALVAALLAPPQPGDGAEGRQRAALDRFFAESERKSFHFMAYRALLTIAGVGGSRGPAAWPDAALAAWCPFQKAMEGYGARLGEALSGRLFDAFAWADRLADYYGEWRRSAAVLNFVLASVAVMLSLLAVIFGHTLKWIFVVLEVFAILVIMANTFRGRFRAWHERWVDYRSVAEQLRLTPILAMTGSSASRPRDVKLGHRGSGASWTSWYCQAIDREAPLPDARVDQAYLRAVAHALASTELAPQVAYQERNARRMVHVDHMLLRAGNISLLGTLAVGVGYLLYAVWLGQMSKPLDVNIANWVTFVAGLLPAVGASALGIREQGEFERRAGASEGMAEQLHRIRTALDAPSATASLARVTNLVEAVVDIMTAELGDWDFIFRAKPLTLP
jgi:hypothetical protein